MNPKKYLKKAARAQHSKLLENGSDLLASLKTQIVPKKKKRRAAVWLSVAACSLALVTAAVCIGVFASREKDIVYYDQNIVFQASDLPELQNLCSEFTVDTSSANRCSVSKAYDSLSGDPLYFELQLWFGREIDLQIVLVCNPHYHFTSFTPQLPYVREFDGYTMLYNLQGTWKNEFYQIDGWGKIQGNHETVHIAFVQLSEHQQDAAFFDLIQTIIRKK